MNYEIKRTGHLIVAIDKDSNRTIAQLNLDGHVYTEFVDTGYVNGLRVMGEIYQYAYKFTTGQIT